MAEKLSQGDPITNISARMWNRMVDAANWFHQQKALGSGLDVSRTLRRTDVVKVRNDSNANRRRGDVLKLGDMLLTDLDPLKLWFAGEEPDAECNFGILIRPVLDDGFEEAQVSGACIAYVNIVNELHDRARIDPESYVLESDCGGPLKILHKASTGTGERECIVCFNNDGRGNLNVELTEDLDFGAFATATVLDGAATGAAIEVYCKLLITGETIASGTQGVASWTGAYHNFIVSRCEEA